MKHKLAIVNGFLTRLFEEEIRRTLTEHLPIDQRKDGIAPQNYWRNTEFALRYIQE